MIVGQNLADGRLELFVRKWDGSVGHIWQTSPGGSWSNWFIHPAPGQVFVSDKADPCVAINADQRLELFVLDSTSELFHKWQIAPGSNWVGWSSLGKPPQLIYRNVAVVRDGIGRLNVFVIGSKDRSVHRIAQTSQNGVWGQWEQVGPTHGTLVGTPAVAVNPGGKIEVFAEGDGKVFHIWQQQIGGFWSNWVWHDGLVARADPVLSMSADGRLELFVEGLRGVSSTYGLYHKWQIAVNANWSNWFDHGLPGGGLRSLPSLEQHDDGRLDLRVICSDSGIYGKTQVAHDAQFGPWFSDRLPATKSSPTPMRNKRPVLALDAFRRLELFVLGNDWQVYNKRQTQPNGSWSNWNSLGGL